MSGASALGTFLTLHGSKMAPVQRSHEIYILLDTLR